MFKILKFLKEFFILISSDITIQRVKKATSEVLQDSNVNRNQRSATYVTEPMKIVAAKKKQPQKNHKRGIKDFYRRICDKILEIE